MTVQPTEEQWALVTPNLALIPWTIRKYRLARNEDDMEDRMADGVFGLVRAATKYDASLGYKFSTYAVPWIRQAVQQGVAAANGIGYRQTSGWNAGKVSVAGGWSPPMSLDYEFRHGIGDNVYTLPVIDSLPSDDDTEGETIATDEVTRTQMALVKACRDAVDLDIAADLINDERASLRAIGARHGVTGEWIRKRRFALYARTRELVGA